MTNNTNFSNVAIIAALLAFGALALAGVLLVSPGDEATQRLGLLFGVIGTAVAALVALLRADQAAKNTNGSLDARIESAVFRANATRRKSDIVPDSDGPTVSNV